MRILGIGNATLDIINSVPHYPHEDEELRVSSQRISMGGNTVNSLMVLSQLGHSCSWGGTYAGSPQSETILNTLAAYAIDSSPAVACDGETPTSYIVLNQLTGSRTILHHRRIREFSAKDFERAAYASFDWVHFEGRNPDELRRMLERLSGSVRCSLEIEKPREGIESCFEFADVLLFSSNYARHCGFTDGDRFLRSMQNEMKVAKMMTCAWGERGAWGVDSGGNLFHEPAIRPDKVVDTVGAGDVFNAALIHGLVSGNSLAPLLTEACRLAGLQCGKRGLDLALPID